MNDDPPSGCVYKGDSYDRDGRLTSVVEFPPEPAPRGAAHLC